MFERYTDECKRAIFFAQQTALREGATAIDSRHLLLGLLSEAETRADVVFRLRDLFPEETTAQIWLTTESSLKGPIPSPPTVRGASLIWLGRRMVSMIIGSILNTLFWASFERVRTMLLIDFMRLDWTLKLPANKWSRTDFLGHRDQIQCYFGCGGGQSVSCWSSHLYSGSARPSRS
jgi:hypothetical protein